MTQVDLEDFPWVDPADTGYEIDEFDPERDTAPDGAGYPWCDGHGPERVMGARALAPSKFTAPNGALLGWGPGWPAGVPAGELVVVVCGANGLRLPSRVQIAPLVAGLVVDLEAARRREGFAPFRPEWCWGYANRPISGTEVASNHSRGTAEDLDAPENPYLSAALHAQPHPLRRLYGGRLLRSTMPLDVQAIAERWGFFWGGLYATKPDPMHFECALTPAQAAQRIIDLRALDGREDAMNSDQERKLDNLTLRVVALGDELLPLVKNDAAGLRKLVAAETRRVVRDLVPSAKDIAARIARKQPGVDADLLAESVVEELASRLGTDIE